MYAEDYSLGRHCSICGAAITDTNPDGIGFQCREVYEKAQWKIFFENRDRANAYNKPETDVLMVYFYSYHYKTKFRSSFRANFFPSIIIQWKEKGFITRRQKEIVSDWLWYKNPDLLHYECQDFTKARIAKRNVFDSWLCGTITQEESNHIVNLANKLRH